MGRGKKETQVNNLQRELFKWPPFVDSLSNVREELSTPSDFNNINFWDWLIGTDSYYKVSELAEREARGLNIPTRLWLRSFYAALGNSETILTVNCPAPIHKPEWEGSVQQAVSDWVRLMESEVGRALSILELAIMRPGRMKESDRFPELLATAVKFWAKASEELLYPIDSEEEAHLFKFGKEDLISYELVSPFSTGVWKRFCHARAKQAIKALNLPIWYLSLWFCCLNVASSQLSKRSKNDVPLLMFPPGEYPWSAWEFEIKCPRYPDKVFITSDASFQPVNAWTRDNKFLITGDLQFFSQTSVIEIMKKIIEPEVSDHPVYRKVIRGGRPHQGAEADAIALECARFRDEEKLTYKQIRERIRKEFGVTWALQKDGWGNLCMCNTAKRYVERGRRLKQENSNTN